MVNKKRPLTKDIICKAALQISEQKGLENLSMRTLAKKLNVEAASLYNHVKNKSELFDLMQTKVFCSFDLPHAYLDWKSYCRELANALRAVFSKQPALMPLFLTRPVVTPESMTVIDQGFGVLYRAGFKAMHVQYIYQTIGVYVAGMCAAHIGTPPQAADEAEPKVSASILDGYENLQTIFSQLNGLDYDNWFEFGLESLLTGFEGNLS